MPKKAIDYSKCEMYKIVCKDEELNYIYVGHTTDFTKRKSGHKTKSRTSELKLYKTIREHGGWDNFKMLQIERDTPVAAYGSAKANRTLSR